MGIQDISMLKKRGSYSKVNNPLQSVVKSRWYRISGQTNSSNTANYTKETKIKKKKLKQRRVKNEVKQTNFEFNTFHCIDSYCYNNERKK